MSKTLLWLDDIRNPNTENWLDYSPIEKPFETIWVKNYNEFVDWIEQKLPKVNSVCVNMQKKIY